MHSYVIENFLTEEQERRLEELTIDPNFPWFFTSATIIDVKNGLKSNSVRDKGINPFQMVHNAYLKKCSFIDAIKPVLDQLPVEFQSNIEIMRCKFNFLPKGIDSTHHYPHIDASEKGMMTALYYVNDSDGDTYFFDAQHNVTHTLAPKRGRMVVFDSNKFHSSSSPTNSEYRIVMNIIFKLRSEEI